MVWILACSAEAARIVAGDCVPSDRDTVLEREHGGGEQHRALVEQAAGRPRRQAAAARSPIVPGGHSVLPPARCRRKALFGP